MNSAVEATVIMQCACEGLTPAQQWDREEQAPVPSHSVSQLVRRRRRWRRCAAVVEVALCSTDCHAERYSCRGRNV